MNAATKINATSANPVLEAVKAKQNVAWGAGDYAKIGTTLQIVGENLAEAMKLDPDSTVLDVAAGNGNATLAFARRWCHVTSTDYVDTLLAQGKARAHAEALEVRFQTADAENLPFGDASFDAVVSTFGVMFTPDQEKAASELVRVCRSGGKIGLANWTPESFVGGLFKTLGRHLPPPPGVVSPALWGTQQWIEATFGKSANSISFQTKHFVFRYRNPAHFVEFFRTYYGPVNKAFLALDADGQKALEADLIALIGEHNQINDGSMYVPAPYGEIVIERA